MRVPRDPDSLESPDLAGLSPCGEAQATSWRLDHERVVSEAGDQSPPVNKIGAYSIWDLPLSLPVWKRPVMTVLAGQV